VVAVVQAVAFTVTATGGGGSLETALTLSLNTNYTVTVGAGGSGVNAGGTKGKMAQILYFLQLHQQVVALVVRQAHLQ
jgi:hypothetical protein